MTGFKEEATNLVRVALGGRMQFLVLRGIDEFARAGGDIDVLVPRDRAGEALTRIADLADRDGWAIAGLSDIGYLSQLCLVKRWDAAGEQQAVKIDIWNGLSWAALGSDPFGDALFAALEVPDDSETVGLTTMLQKLLYAGFLRDRDLNRIFGACDIDLILAFTTRNGIPLTRADLQAGRLDRIARWRLRAASAGVTPAGLPVWTSKVAWRTLRFRIFRSAFGGSVIAVSGADRQRRAALVDRFRELLRQSGMRPPTVETGPDGRASGRSGLGGAGLRPRLLTMARIWLRAFRGETVIIYGTFSSSPPPLVPGHEWRSLTAAKETGTVLAPVRVRLPDDGGETDADRCVADSRAGAKKASPQAAGCGGDDLDLLLARVSEQALRSIRRNRKK